MASVSNVSPSISNGSTANTQNVTVSGAVQFDVSEVGKSYRLEIKIFGEDKSGDKLPSSDPVGDDEIYAFLWGATIFSKKPYKPFTVAAAGPQPFAETRPISDERLDEDRGTLFHTIEWEAFLTILFQSLKKQRLGLPFLQRSIVYREGLQ